MAMLPTSPLWWSGRTPDAPPYGMHHACFDVCPDVPENQLRWFPSCQCTYVVSEWPPAAAGGEAAPEEEAQATRHRRAAAT